MTKLTVTLSHEDIADITNDMNNAFPPEEKPSQAYLEFLLCQAVIKRKSVDFFEEQRAANTELDNFVRFVGE
jgi:hypothetical protein